MRRMRAYVRVRFKKYLKFFKAFPFIFAILFQEKIIIEADFIDFLVGNFYPFIFAFQFSLNSYIVARSNLFFTLYNGRKGPIYMLTF